MKDTEGGREACLALQPCRNVFCWADNNDTHNAGYNKGRLRK